MFHSYLQDQDLNQDPDPKDPVQDLVQDLDLVQELDQDSDPDQDSDIVTAVFRIRLIVISNQVIGTEEVFSIFS